MVGSRELAADLCQEAMVRIIQGLPGFDGASQFTTWATRVTMNVCLTHLRSAKLRRHASLDGPAGRDGRSIAGRIGPSKAAEAERSDSDRFDALQVQEPNPGQRVQQQDERARLLAALAKLEPEHRAILVLRDVQGLDYDHIAHALDIPGGTVKSRLFRARAALRSLIEPPPPPQTSA
jgi:RNA polymerase sigma-70 factor (ECF subfamily)